MGVDAKAYINPIAPIDDVVKVMGLLLGAPVDKTQRNTYNIIQVNDIQISLPLAQSDKNSSYPRFNAKDFYPMLSIDLPLANGKKHHVGMHLHADSSGRYLLMSRSTVLNIALYTQLINIFGGHLIASDCDGEVSIKVAKGRWKKLWTDDEDEGYIQKNQFLEQLKTLTYNDLVDAMNIAVYEFEDDIEQYAQELNFPKVIIAKKRTLK